MFNLIINFLKNFTFFQLIYQKMGVYGYNKLIQVHPVMLMCGYRFSLPYAIYWSLLSRNADSFPILFINNYLFYFFIFLFILFSLDLYCFHFFIIFNLNLYFPFFCFLIHTDSVFLFILNSFFFSFIINSFYFLSFFS